MGTEGFFDGLGEMLGRAIRFVVDLLSGLLGGIWGAMDDFLHGLARAIGMDASLFSFVLWCSACCCSTAVYAPSCAAR